MTQKMPPTPSIGRGTRFPAPRAPAAETVFTVGDDVVYPTHGVGRVERILAEEVAGHSLELILISFEDTRMTLRVPTAKARTSGLRKLATRAQLDSALRVLRGRPRVKRTMWSRRAQEYEAKINSGDPLALAEVVRDLCPKSDEKEQSFSERLVYEQALDRLAGEVAAIDQVDKVAAVSTIQHHLKKTRAQREDESGVTEDV